MRRTARLLGALLVVCGLGAMLWSLVVWRWQDPFTALYNRYEQRKLGARYDERLAAVAPNALVHRSASEAQREIAAQARRYRRWTRRGEPIGRLKIPRLDLDVVVVDGTDPETLKRGPGRYRGSYMPGEGELVYVAGHRTTYGAPFADIDSLRPGDRVTMELPYATFRYVIADQPGERTGKVVRDTFLAALESRRREELALQACWPRFFATHRYIAYARPLSVTPRGGRSYPFALEDSARRRSAGS